MNKHPDHIGIMWKTVSGDCNLACGYCYYSTCGGLQGKKSQVVAPEQLEALIRNRMKSSRGSASFVWQGGEPLLAGLDFYRQVIDLQIKHAPPHTSIGNAVQTNGTLITREWARFFKQHHFLVGVSLDGPESIHDSHRVYPQGRGSFRQVMRGIRYLQQEGVDFNILTVIHEGNVERAEDLARFNKANGFRYVQHLPCMDFTAQDTHRPVSYRISPEQYGQFLCEMFDVWYNGGRPAFSERFFDSLLIQHMGLEAELCAHRSACPKMLVLEANGDAYPCDFYLHDEYKLGNIAAHTLDELVAGEAYRAFAAKKGELPGGCGECGYFQFCQGGCPRNRVSGRSGDSAADYFCRSYQQIYAYSEDRLKRLALALR